MCCAEGLNTLHATNIHHLATDWVQLELSLLINAVNWRVARAIESGHKYLATQNHVFRIADFDNFRRLVFHSFSWSCLLEVLGWAKNLSHPTLTLLKLRSQNYST